MFNFIVEVLGFMLGFVLFLGGVVLFLARKTWVVAPFLSNDPKNPNKFSCFTTVEQGELKVIFRGDKVVGYIMNMPEKSLRRNKTDPNLTINNAKYADIVNEPADTEMDDLLYWSEPSLREWRERIYRKSGYVFVGIPPWQRLGYRPFRSAKLNEDRTSITYAEGLTDHMRVREFARPFMARSVETAENLKVTVGIEITFVTTNGFEQWFGVDRFEIRLDNIVPARLQEFLKTQSIEKILTAEEGTARAIEEYLLGSPDGSIKGVLEEALSGYGLQAKRGHVFELDPELTKEEEEALTAEWRAKKRKAARKLDAEADAHYLQETSEHLKNNPGLVQVEAAKAAASGKGTSTFFFSGGAVSGVPNGSMEAASLAELQRIRGNKGGEGT